MGERKMDKSGETMQVERTNECREEKTNAECQSNNHQQTNTRTKQNSRTVTIDGLHHRYVKLHTIAHRTTFLTVFAEPWRVSSSDAGCAYQLSSRTMTNAITCATHCTDICKPTDTRTAAETKLID